MRLDEHDRMGREREIEHELATDADAHLRSLPAGATNIDRAT
jgi:hypothetical protein